VFFSTWKAAGVSVTGFTHQRDSQPCQDYHQIAIERSWLLAAASDGAGSALHSAEGATAICKEIVAELLLYVKNNFAGDVGNVNSIIVRSWIEKSIEKTRTLLSQSTYGHLEDFQATLVGVIAGASGGILFHIGDGAACATKRLDRTCFAISEPENGEYTNETHFFTDDTWRDHLRLTEFGSELDTIVLMTDGVTPFALTSTGDQLFEPFFSPVCRFLQNCSREEGERALAATLSQQHIRNITGDDKTLVWTQRICSDGD
jgi:hypothetical protein